MKLAPRYDGPVVLSIDGPADDQLVPFRRQRLRMMAMLAELTDEQWHAASRCAGWTTRDVVAHLVDVNAFWHASITAGLAGAPSRLLVGFDPATTPPQLVDRSTTLSAAEIRERFASSSDALLDVVTGLRDEQWSTPAESPAGHVPIRLVVQHALWDCWVHERDIAVPLGIAAVAEPDELRSCLQYAAVVGPVLGVGVGGAPTTVVAVESTDPVIRFVVEIGGSVSLRDGVAPDVPCLRGDALALVEGLSLRSPMPGDVPAQWSQVVAVLATAFDAAPR